MPVYKVQQIFEFVPGTVNGSTEDPPDDILDSEGVMVPLAVWPREPLEFEADDEDEAIEAGRRHKQKNAEPEDCYRNTAISEDRFAELCSRPRPGGTPDQKSVGVDWAAEEME
jgi:hypothetical protein